MSESRQLSVRLPEEVFAGLEKLRPSGVTLAEVARKIITKVVMAPEQLPLLDPGAGRGSRYTEVNWEPFVTEMAAFRDRLEEAQRETLRAVQEHGSWGRLRLSPVGDAVMDQKARDQGEQLVRDWERSVGRADA